MNKVTTINLNGRAYQLEKRGFDALRKYLETAAAKLDGNPDKDEIMADFEQAIADKCDQKLAGHKNVISEREIEDIIAAMGPVEGTADKETDDEETKKQKNVETNGSAAAPRRLFRIPQGEWIMGVCTGLAAYFNLDVTLVRVIFVLLTVFTHAFWILAYVILAIVMPVAKSDDEFAQAHGWSQTQPFNAHDFIEQAKARYGQLHDELQKMHDEHKAQHYGSTIKQEMREKKEQMKQEWRTQRRAQRQARHEARRTHDSERYAAQDHNPGWIASQVFLGIFSVIISVAIAALAAAWAFAIYSLIKHGTILGYAFAGGASGAGHSIWIPIIFLTAVLYIIVIPFASLLHGAWGMAYYRDARRSGAGSFGRAVIFLAVLIVLFFTARELFPQVGTWWTTAVAWLKARV